jgi:hypothetical protein
MEIADEVRAPVPEPDDRDTHRILHAVAAHAVAVDLRS